MRNLQQDTEKQRSPLDTTVQFGAGWRAELACKDAGRSKELPIKIIKED